ncbi:MAG: TerC family protein [Candidatus Rokubacteria bacterium]|nr:TerC family protein [Candidatus Rokubacteria bacterium]
MDIFMSAAFWLGLAQIAYLNLLLSGDNALVIALAVRTLPKRKRILGQIWGAAGAVVLRLAFLAIVMYLLEVRFLRLSGGLLLIWIAFKLVQSETGVESEVKGGASLWEAIWIIIIADVTMSLDNVLAVAAAAHGDLVLIIFGIGLSLPIVVWGAGFLARLMNRYAWIVWLGGGILGKVAGEMILEDRFVRGWSWAHGWDRALPGGITVDLHPLPIALGVLLAVLGWWLARGKRHRVPENV